MIPDKSTSVQELVERLDPSQTEAVAQEADRLVAAGFTTFGQLLSALNDPAVAPELRASSAWLIGRLGRPGAGTELVSVLGDSDPYVRRAAVMALGQIGDARASHALMAVLRADREPEVRKAAAYSLGQIGTSEVLDALLQTVSNGTEASSVRGMAVEALTYLRESSGHVVSTLRAVLGDPAPEVRFWAAFALGELGDPAALEDLRRVTSDTGKVPGYGSVADEAKEAIARIEERNREVGIPEFPQAT